MYRIEPGGTLYLSWQSEAGTTDLYPQGKIYDDTDTLVATVNLTHRQSGRFTGTSTALSATGLYVVQFIAYTDAAHTITSGVDPILSESIQVAYDFRQPIIDIPESFGKAEKENKELKKELQEIKEELAKKSEFNPKTDIVKTDIKIPIISFRQVFERFDFLKDYISQKVGLIAPKDYSKQLDELKSQIGQLPKELPSFPDLAFLESKLDKIEEKQKEIYKEPQNFGNRLINNKDISQLVNLLQRFQIQFNKESETKEQMLEALNEEEAKRMEKIINEISKGFQLLLNEIRKLESIEGLKEGNHRILDGLESLGRIF